MTENTLHHYINFEGKEKFYSVETFNRDNAALDLLSKFVETSNFAWHKEDKVLMMSELKV